MKTSNIIYVINCKDRKITTTKDLAPSNKVIIADEHNGIGSDQGVVEALNNVLKHAKQQGYRKFWIADSDLFNYSRIDEIGTVEKIYSGKKIYVNKISNKFK